MENTSITDNEDDREMNLVMKTIYSSCDPDNRNAVEVSKLIKFIEPYMTQDLSALETLKLLLDPYNENVCVTSETFYTAMNKWTKRLHDSNGDFGKSPGCSKLDKIDDHELLFVQSTPRSSFGKAILNCSELLSLSFNSSSMDDNSLDIKLAHEEEINKMTYKLNKISNETVTLKLQLHSAEEQIELLQTDLELVNRKLEKERQLNEQLQRDQKEFKELYEELMKVKYHYEVLQKKKNEFEKKNLQLNKFVEKLENEKSAMEQKIEILTKKEQNAKTHMFDAESELELKERQIEQLIQGNAIINTKLTEQQDIIDQFTNEIELLTQKNEALEQVFKNVSKSSIGSRGADKTHNSNESGEQDKNSEKDLFCKLQDDFYCNNEGKWSPHESLQTEICKVSLGIENYNCERKSIQNTKDIKQLEEEKEILLANLDNQKSCIEGLTNEMRTLQSKFRYIQKEKEDLVETLKKLEFVEDDLKDCMAKNVDLTTSNNIFETDSKKLHHKIDKLESTLSNLRTVNINQEMLLRSKKDKIKSLEQTIIQLQSTLEEKLTYIELLKNDISNLSLKNQEFEYLLNKVQQELIDSKTENKEVKELCKKIETTLHSIELNLVNRTEAVSDLEDINEKLKSNVESNEIIICQKLNEIDELRAELKKYNETKNNLWQDLHSLSAELIYQQESMECQINQQKQDYDKLFKDFKELQYQHNDLVNKNKCFETKLEKEILVNNTLLKEIDFLKLQLNSKDEECKTIKSMSKISEEKINLFIKKSEIQHQELIDVQKIAKQELEYLMEDVAKQKDSPLEQMKKEASNKENILQELAIKLSTCIGISHEQNQTDSAINIVNHLMNTNLLNAKEKSTDNPNLKQGSEIQLFHRAGKFEKSEKCNTDGTSETVIKNILFDSTPNDVQIYLNVNHPNNPGSLKNGLPANSPTYLKSQFHYENSICNSISVIDHSVIKGNFKKENYIDKLKRAFSNTTINACKRYATKDKQTNGQFWYSEKQIFNYGKTSRCPKFCKCLFCVAEKNHSSNLLTNFVGRSVWCSVLRSTNDEMLEFTNKLCGYTKIKYKQWIVPIHKK